MEHSLWVRCSNCGDFAKRTYTLALDTVVKTECCHCDYYLEVGFSSGKVIEAHTFCTAVVLHQKTNLVPIIQHQRSILRPLVDLPA